VIALGIICLLVGAAVVVLLLVVGFSTITIATFGGNQVITRPFWVFLLGAATLLIVMMGLSLLRRGTRRQFQRRREIKQLRKEAQSTPAPGTGADRVGGSDARTGSAAGTGVGTGAGTSAGTGPGTGARGPDDTPGTTGGGTTPRTSPHAGA